MTVMKSMQFSLAPEKLWQAINPVSFYQQGAQFGLINIDVGITPRPEVEQDILDEVGSYGRQIGWIGEALEVLMNHVPLEGLSGQERETIDIMRGKLAEIRQIKRRHRVPDDASG